MKNWIGCTVCFLLCSTLIAAEKLDIATINPTMVVVAGDPTLPGGMPDGATPLTLGLTQPQYRSCLLKSGPLDLSTGDLHLSCLLYGGDGTGARDFRLMATDDKDRPRELGKLPVPNGGWRIVPSVISKRDVILRDLTLIAVGNAPAWVAYAQHNIQPLPAALDGLSVNCLRPISYDGSKGFPQSTRTLWNIFPRPTASVVLITPGSGSVGERDRATLFQQALVSGWNVVPPYRSRKNDWPAIRDPENPLSYNPVAAVVTPTDIWFYQDGAQLGTYLNTILTTPSAAVCLHISTATKPDLKPDGLAKFYESALRVGCLVTIVLEERIPDIKMRKEWDAWMFGLHRLCPSLPIIDLELARGWRELPGAAQINLMLDDGSAFYAPLTPAYRDLRARLEWSLFDARDESDSLDAGRRRRP